MLHKTLCSLLVAPLLLGVAQAKPVLVAVELAERAQIDAWLTLGHPTYEYLGGTAIAEVDEGELAGLGQHFLIVSQHSMVQAIHDHLPQQQRGQADLVFQ